MSYPALLTDVGGNIIPQYYDGAAWQPYEGVLRYVNPSHTSIQYTSMTGTSYTAQITTNRGAITRGLILVNNTNVSFNSPGCTFWFTDTFVNLSGVGQSGESSSDAPSGGISVGTYATLSSEDTTSLAILRAPFNTLNIKVNYTTAPTSGTFDIYLFEQL